MTTRRLRPRTCRPGRLTRTVLWKARPTTARATALAGGAAAAGGGARVARGTVWALFQSGADEPLSYGFAANAIATLQALGLTSGGVALDYAIVANTVTASTAAGDVFTFTLNPATGAWTFTLIDQLDHAPGNNENDLAINLGAIVQATDADGDSVTGNATGLVVTVDDDSPTNYTPAPQTITDVAGSIITGAMNTVGHVGADELGTLTITSLTKGGVTYTVDGATTTM